MCPHSFLCFPFLYSCVGPDFQKFGENHMFHVRHKVLEFYLRSLERCKSMNHDPRNAKYTMYLTGYVFIRSNVQPAIMIVCDGETSRDTQHTMWKVT